MRHNCTHTISPLTKSFSTKVNFKCTGKDKNYFMSTNKILGRAVLIFYLNCGEEAIIHTDASKT